MADGIMDRIETINSIPLCDRDARAELKNKANIDHTHDNYATKIELDSKANVIHTHNDYVLRSEFESLLNKIRDLENKIKELENKIKDLESIPTPPTLISYTITYENSTGVIISNYASSIEQDSRYTNIINYAEGYEYESISVLMGGVDITNNVLIAPGPNQHAINIEKVTGSIVIRIKAKKIEIPTYNITYNLGTGIALNHRSISVKQGASMEWIITCSDGYKLNSGACYITMGGVDVSSNVFHYDGNNNIISIKIGNVTGNINIQLASDKKIYSIAYSLSGSVSSNNLKQIRHGEPYYARITPSEANLVLHSVQLIMGDNNVTYPFSTMEDKEIIIDIPSVTGDLYIKVGVLLEGNPETYEIFYYLTGVTSSNDQISIEKGKPYYSKITLTNNNYSIASATLTINRVPKNQYLTITDHVIVDIPAEAINGDIVITVETKEISILCTGISVSDITVAVNTNTPALYVCSPINCNEKLYVESLTFMDTSIAKKEGIVNIEGVNPGTTTATLTMRGSVSGQTFSDTFNVHVTAPCTSLTCNGAMTLGVGADANLNVNVQPSNTVDNVYWDVSDSSALSVYKSSGGYWVHAVKPGNYTVTLYCGNRAATCRVTIENRDIKCTNIAFNVPSIRVSANEGSWDCAQYLILTPSNTTDRVEWYTDTEDYFYVTQEGTISFNRVGTYKVQARCNGKSATLTVIIN